jgi:hydrogenase maturation protease
MSMGGCTVLIAGVGNIFFGDDAFGVEVVRRLAGRGLPDRIHVKDFGIRGLDLAYALLDGGYGAAILVDAVARGGSPGTLYTIRPDLAGGDDRECPEALLKTHGMDPLRVLRMVKSMGGNLKNILIVGCEPLTLAPDEGLMGLSAPIAAAVDEALSLIELLAREVLAEASSFSPS